LFEENCDKNYLDIKVAESILLTSGKEFPLEWKLVDLRLMIFVATNQLLWLYRDVNYVYIFEKGSTADAQMQRFFG